MEKVVMSENELAQHWGVNLKTLQRWRSEGRGPRYLKLSKKVVYPLVEIRTFEANALYASTSERVGVVTRPCSRKFQLLSGKEIGSGSQVNIIAWPGFKLALRTGEYFCRCLSHIAELANFTL